MSDLPDLLTADLLSQYATDLDWPARKAHCLRYRKPPFLGNARRILITHPDNINFLGSLVRGFETDSRYQVRVRCGDVITTDDVDWADTIITDWCTKLAAHLSFTLPPNKTHIIRLHSYEAFTPHPITVHWGGVHGLVFVADHIQKHVMDTLGLADFPRLRVHTIPIGHDVDSFNQPKNTQARYTLGLNHYHLPNKCVGMAVEILECLRAKAPQHPWQLRLLGDGAVAAPPQGPGIAATQSPVDMPLWFHDIGWILSTSHREGTHETVAEGMSSGAVPVVRRWPALPGGAETRYPNALLFDAALEAADLILATLPKWDQASAAATGEALNRFTIEKEHIRWVLAITGT